MSPKPLKLHKKAKPEKATAVPAVVAAPAETAATVQEPAPVPVSPPEAAPPQPVEAAATAAPVEEQKPQRPEMPAQFCLEPAEWAGNNNAIYADESNDCKQCQKDYPDTAAACKARQDFLALVESIPAGKNEKTAKKARPASSGRASRTPSNGRKPASVRIDDLLKERKPLDEIVAAIAVSEYGSEGDAAKKSARVRIESHLKAIRTGTYCRADLMKPEITYLNAAPAAPATAAAPAAPVQ